MTNQVFRRLETNRAIGYVGALKAGANPIQLKIASMGPVFPFQYSLNGVEPVEIDQ